MRRIFTICAAAAVLMTAAGCTGEGEGEEVRVRVPNGASFSAVTDSLASKGVISAPTLIRIYARLTNQDHRIRPGTYGFRQGAGWKTVLDDLTNGRVLTMRLVIPEGWDLRKISARLAELSGAPADSIFDVLSDPETAKRFDVPGPTLEGYLYPATYTLPVDLPLDAIIGGLVKQYRAIWTPERRAAADSIGLSEREVVTLASIIEREAKVRSEMPIISAVYHNRLRIGMPLQADPTVQYALGEHQARLLYAHIDSVQDNPYNTYRHRGLPPGPIASPSILAIDAALHPADVKFLYFVARADGSHVFTRTFDEHRRARAMIRREQALAGRGQSPATAAGQ